MSDPRYDVVVFGATSFVGQILVRYLTEQFGVHGELKWAIAGRSDEKLRDVRQAVGKDAIGLPLMVANASSETSMKEMCGQTRVVISTVGPYALYGEALVKVCAQTGTDYCDLTGETQFIRRMVDKYEKDAQASGARIVHCCGFDSIPSDLGVFFLQQEAVERFGEPCSDVTMRVKTIKGGASGGTIASMLNVVKEAVGNPSLRKELANPYYICPPSNEQRPRQHTVKGAEYDANVNSWIAPFVMAAVNERVVLRTNALTGDSYGKDFSYNEAMQTGPGFKGKAIAWTATIGIGMFMLAAVIPPLRWLMERFLLPKPGEGPSPEQQLNGFYDLRFVGKTASGKTIKVKVTGDRDPGYGSTAKILGQAGVCIVKDIAKSDKAGGFWTTAIMFENHLLKRLRKDAGLTFDVIE